jgi:hypothetical protein
MVSLESCHYIYRTGEQAGGARRYWVRARRRSRAAFGLDDRLDILQVGGACADGEDLGSPVDARGKRRRTFESLKDGDPACGDIHAHPRAEAGGGSSIQELLVPGDRQNFGVEAVPPKARAGATSAST